MSAEPIKPDPLQNELPKQYRVLGKIKSGGMGAIYKVENTFTQQICAVKVMKADQSENEILRKRFIVEAKAASLLQHPHICQTYDFGISENNVLYLVMQWLDGISLEQKVSRDGPVSVQETTVIFMQVATALAHAHEHNVVHRDLKPDNIMLSRDRSGGGTTVHIVDFGIAKMVKDDGATPTNDGLTRVGALIGTPAYMSPEQAMASRVDARCDVYALGCVMYFALTGNPPFTSNNVMDLLYKHVHSAPPEFDPALKIPNAMKSIVLKCLEKKPEDRYQSMTQVCTDLKKLTKGVAVERKLLAKDRKLIYGLVKMCAIFFAAYLLSVFGNLAIQNLNDTVKKDSVAKVGTNKSLTGSSKGDSGSGTTGSANKSQRRRQR
ncbi:MAG: serine/threonine protein kinase [Candidatus Obscuribacter sp.]|nr:serine/threonine protein kinase [Candidatus Obscuribacter sp.]MBK9770078.1 serine/threonine protein kinase [Candidatus Obscuribacter sp.]